MSPETTTSLADSPCDQGSFPIHGYAGGFGFKLFKVLLFYCLSHICVSANHIVKCIPLNIYTKSKVECLNVSQGVCTILC